MPEPLLKTTISPTWTVSGITLPDGTVKPLTVQVGDIVVFSRGSGMEYKSSTEIFKIISYKEIFGKIVKGN